MSQKSPNRFDDILPLIDKWVLYQLYYAQIPGIAIGIIEDGKVIFKKEYGYANLEDKIELTDQHLFLCASHAKLFTASAILQLHSENKLELNDYISKYLSWFKSEKDSNLEKITILNLLTHTSGIAADVYRFDGDCWNYPDLEELKTQIQAGISCYEVDSKIKYSNIGYIILGSIIEQISGIRYSEYIQRNIFDPLQMKNSYVDITPENHTQLASGYYAWYPNKDRFSPPKAKAGAYASAGGLISNVEDLLKFYQAHFLGNNTLFNDSIKIKMQEIHVQKENERRGLGFAIGNFPMGQKICYINGGAPGFKSHSGIIQQEKIAIVVLTNALDAPDFSLFLGISEFLNLILTKREEFGDNLGICINPEENLENKSGFYESPYGIFLIGKIQNRLMAFNMESWNPAQFPCVFQYLEDGKYTGSVQLPFMKEGESIQFIKKTEDKYALLGCDGVEIKKFEF